MIINNLILKDEHMGVILVNMCRYVEANYLEIDFHSDNWYRQYSWTEATQNRFRKWFINYIYSMKDAQRELYDRSHMRKSDCEKYAAMFIMNYGWIIKEGSADQ